MKAIHIALSCNLLLFFGCGEKEVSWHPNIQTVYPPISEPLNQVWVMSAEWAGFMGVAIGLSSNRYYYWFYSDVIRGDEPECPLVGSYTLEANRLTLDESEHHLYSTEWLVTTNGGRICLWASQDAGNSARILIPDENFNATDPFANQKKLKAEPVTGEVRETSSRPSDRRATTKELI